MNNRISQFHCFQLKKKLESNRLELLDPQEHWYKNPGILEEIVPQSRPIS